MREFNKYTVLDQPGVVQLLFHPRPETGQRISDKNRRDYLVPVGEGVDLGASLYFVSKESPLILFFHGNGEVVSDYDDLARYFTGQGLNFFVVDYRGYGQSSGHPTVSAMMADSHKVLDFLVQMRQEQGLCGRVCVMGRSLGSAPALELAWKRQGDFSCLVIESGFAHVSPLLETLGLDPEGLGLDQGAGYGDGAFENIDKIKKVTLPCLIIHAQYDHIIPFLEGRALYEACPSADKTLLEIRGANHNDLFFKGMAPYLGAVKKICGL